LTKSQLSNFIGLYSGILKDIEVYHPTLRKDLGRDLLRLKTLASNSGSKVFTLLLPALGKRFDLSLETGVLDLHSLPLSRRWRVGSKIPRLFRGIWMTMFDDNGCLKSDIDPNDVLFMRTLLFAMKKYQSECAPSATFEAVKEYYDVEASLPEPSQIWDGDGSDFGPNWNPHLSDFSLDPAGLLAEVSDREDWELLCITQKCADRVATVLGEFIPSKARFRHGPGAVSDLASRKDFKYSFPAWGPRLQHIFPASEFAFANLRESVNVDDYEAPNLPLVEGISYLIAVPKTQKSPRLIAKEPTCHQWCQQSVRDFLTDAIGRCYIGRSIDFGRQDLSGEAARHASITKESATVDLSSASDRLSCALVERVFRRNPTILSALVASRTRYLANRIDKKSPSLHKLRKFASMGSALTFPIQSLVFYTLCLSAGIATERPHKWDLASLSRRVRVYGDDLIIPVAWMPMVEKLFKLLLLKINRDKTFSKGNFRESCGSDCFSGYFVSPGQVRQFYQESSLTSLQGHVQSANNLYFKGLWHAASALLHQVPDKVRNLIPILDWRSESFGLLSASGYLFHSKRRWNKDLQREEYAAITFRVKALHTSRHEGSANLLQFFTEDPTNQMLSIWESGRVTEPLSVARKGWVLPV
jgi:hypothetical protein